MSQNTTFTTPVGRFVQGSMLLEPKKDVDGKPKLGDDGKQVFESFVALAIAKDNPELPAFMQLITGAGMAAFAHLFNAQGQCLINNFAWKMQDGDGVDKQGKSVANKEGFPGHWIFKFTTQFAPRVYRSRNTGGSGDFSTADLIIDGQDAAGRAFTVNDIVKRGHFIRISGSVRGNGVKPENRQAVPGLFLSHSLVEHVGYGKEIVSGPDANEAFAQKPASAYVPAGMSATPVGTAGPTAAPAAGGMPTPGAAAMPTPGVAAPAAAAMPTPTAAMPTPAAAMPAPGGMPTPGAMPVPGAAAMPAPAAQPQYQPTALAQGATVDQLLGAGLGWTIETLLAQGVITRVG